MEIIKTISNILAIILSVGFLGAGMIKLVAVDEISNSFAVWGYPSWSIYVIGMIELALFVGFFIARFRLVSCLLAFLLMSGAIYTHLTNLEYDQIYGPLIILFLIIGLGVTTKLGNENKPVD